MYNDLPWWFHPVDILTNIYTWYFWGYCVLLNSNIQAVIIQTVQIDILDLHESIYFTSDDFCFASLICYCWNVQTNFYNNLKK